MSVPCPTCGAQDKDGLVQLCATATGRDHRSRVLADRKESEK